MFALFFSYPLLYCSSYLSLLASLIFLPFVATIHTLIESSHGLIRRSNLQLEEICLVTSTRVNRALSRGLVDIVPSSISSQHVINFLSIKLLSLKHQEPIDLEFIGTGGTCLLYTSRCV